MRNIIVHAGTHKTGTTSFQQFLYDHRDWLKSQDVEPYLELHGRLESTNCYYFAHDLLRPEIMTMMRYTGIVPSPNCRRLLSAVKRIRAFISATTCKTVIFSAEAFCFFRTDAESRRLRLALGDDVQIIPLIAFRGDEEWRRSWAAGIARSPEIAPRMTNPGFPLLLEWWFDKHAIRNFWLQFGQVLEVNYDKAMQERQDIIPELLSAIGLEFPGEMTYRLNSTSKLL